MAGAVRLYQQALKLKHQSRVESHMSSSSISIPKTLESSIRQCISLARLHSENKLGPNAKDIVECLSQGMALLWDALARTTAFLLPLPLEASTNANYPGYVYIEQGETSYAVPFFLADLFPKGEQLVELNELSRRIRVKKDSAICLSGSGCSVGTKIPVADLDFCEYLNRSDARLPERLVIAAQTVTGNLLCLKVTVNSKIIWRRPWNQDVERPTQDFFQKTFRSLQKSSHKKVDYLAQTENFGVLEVTNKLIFLDFMNAEGGEAQSSFTMQEVPLGNSTWVPRSLANPIEVGRYVEWLFREVRSHLQKSRNDPRYSIKALRRAMPLSRILMARAEMQKIYELLSDDNGARLAALHDRCALYATLESQQLIGVGTYADSLSRSILSLRKTEDPGTSLSALSATEQQALQNYSIIVRAQVDEIVNALEQRIYLSS